MVLRRVGVVLLSLAAVGSTATFATVSEGRWHPLATLVSLLPLQLAALIWALPSAPAAAARLRPVPRPPASD